MPDSNRGRDVVHQAQPFAHVVHGDAVARTWPADGNRVGDRHDGLAALHARADADDAALVCGLDAMAHRVLDQRLQQERRHSRLAGGSVEIPRDSKAVAEADLFDREIALRQVDLLGQRDGRSGVAQRHSKQLCQIFQQAFGTGRIDTRPGRSRC